MRLFIAVNLSDGMKKALVGTMHDLKKAGVEGSYVPMQNLHMTLAFIGETTQTEQIRSVMDQIPVEKSRISFSEFGYFSDTLWIGIRGNQKMKKYVADLRKLLKEQGIPCDTSKFEPHVTLIRRQKGRRISGWKVPEGEMTFSRVSLMKSEMKDGKRIYREIYSV